VVDVRNDYEKFQAAGDVAVITMGTVEQTAGFAQRLKLPFVCLADPDQTAYKKFGVHRGGVSEVAGPKVWAAGLRALVRGGAGKPVGDVLQMHAAFVIDSEGRIQLAEYPENSADITPNSALLTAMSATQ